MCHFHKNSFPPTWVRTWGLHYTSLKMTTLPIVTWMNVMDYYTIEKNPTDSEFWQNPVKVLFFFCLKHPYQEIFNEFIFDHSILLHMCSNVYYITPYILCRILINLCVLCYEFKQWCACMSTPLKITQQCRKYALMRRTSKWQSIQNRDCPKK